MESDKKKIALFIDADNAPAKKIDIIITELAKFGTVNIRRAYGNWKSDRLGGWAAILNEYAIQPVQQFDLIKGKNATDQAMVIEAMDVLYTKSVDIFCIVSSDCDFTPLAIRLIAEGKTVLGFGEKKTPKPFIDACSRFLYLDQEVADPPLEQSVSGKDKLKGNTKLIALLRNAVEACEDNDGWAPLGRIGQNIANQGSFDQRNYGFKKLSDLFIAIDLFETKTGEANSFWVRNRKSRSSKGN